MSLTRYDIIDQKLFINNRKKLVEKLKPNSIVVIHSNDVMPTSADGTMPFIQQTDLFYLTGIDQEETILVLYPDAREGDFKEILFVRKTSEDIAIWEGEKFTKDQATLFSGIEHVEWTDQFEFVFNRLIFDAEFVYLATNEHLRNSSNAETKNDRFLKWCTESYPLHKYERLAPIMHKIRAIKSPEELELIRRACTITERAFKRVLSFVKPGVWEYEIEAEIYHEFISNKSRRMAYSPIIASGSSSCVLHYITNNKQCKDGDLLLLDFGAEYANYASDLSRTIPVNGRFSSRQKEVYNAVLNVQKMAIDILRPGVLLKEFQSKVGKLVEEELIKLGLLNSKEVKSQDPKNPLYKKYFMHGTSHYLGLDVHDYGDMNAIIEEGMVFTCEPGIYIREEGVGIRIENNILIGSSENIDFMNNTPREVEEIEEFMNR